MTIKCIYLLICGMKCNLNRSINTFKINSAIIGELKQQTVLSLLFLLWLKLFLPFYLINHWMDVTDIIGDYAFTIIISYAIIIKNKNLAVVIISVHEKVHTVVCLRPLRPSSELPS